MEISNSERAAVVSVAVGDGIPTTVNLFHIVMETRQTTGVKPGVHYATFTMFSATCSAMLT